MLPFAPRDGAEQAILGRASRGARPRARKRVLLVTGVRDSLGRVHVSVLVISLLVTAGPACF